MERVVCLAGFWYGDEDTFHCIHLEFLCTTSAVLPFFPSGSDEFRSLVLAEHSAAVLASETPGF